MDSHIKSFYNLINQVDNIEQINIIQNYIHLYKEKLERYKQILLWLNEQIDKFNSSKSNEEKIKILDEICNHLSYNLDFLERYPRFKKVLMDKLVELAEEYPNSQYYFNRLFDYNFDEYKNLATVY